MSSTRPRHARSSKLSQNDLLGAAIAELLGTFLLVCLPTAVATEAASEVSIAGAPADSLAVAFAFGITLFVLVRIFAERSGANFNPAVTVGLLLHRQMQPITAAAYVVAQLIGAVLGSLMTQLWFSGQSNANGFGVTQPASGVNVVVVLLVEFIGTALLTLSIATVALGKQSAFDTAMTIGATLFVIVLAGGALTGGAFNPARALGPMITTLQFKDWWAYIIAELIGGYAGVALFLRYFRKVEQPD